MIKVFSVILICCLGSIVYSNTFHCWFHFDDFYFIVGDSAIKNIHDLAGIWSYYPGRFLTFLSIALNYHLHGLSLPGYHLLNLIVHLTSAILVWWLVLLTLSTPVMKDNSIARHADLMALLAGLIFVAHPLQTEAVTYIWQRTASMAAMFYLACLCLYVKSRLRDTGGVNLYYIGSLLAAVAAMFTKENAISLPLMVLFYEFSFFRTGKNLNWKIITPFLLTILVIPLTMFLTKSVNFQETRLSIDGPITVSRGPYLLTEFRVLVTYLRLLLLPVNQSLDYDYPVSGSLFAWPTFLSFIFLLTLLFVAQRLFLKYRLVSFSIFWFFLTLLPESSFIPFDDVIFEHRLYLPMAGYSIFLVSGLYYLVGKKDIKIMVTILLLVIGCNSVLTYQRNKVWKDEISLWGDVVKKFPHKARGYNNLGNAYAGQGNFAQAIADFNKALALDPKFEKAYNNRGCVYSKEGFPERAIADFDSSIEASPGFAEAYINRGFVYNTLGNGPQAMSDYDKAIELRSTNADAYYNRGLIYDKQGDLPQALSDFNRALELNPQYSEVYNDRGLVYYKQGHLPQALADYNKAVELDPRYADSYDNRGVFYDRQGLWSQAMADYNKGIELNPNSADTYTNRGVLYAKESNFTQAASDFNKAVEIDPKNAQAYNNLGSIYSKQNNFPQAILEYTKALALNPDYADAYHNRGIIHAQQGDWADALSDYSRAIASDPQFTVAYYNRAIAYYQLRKFDEAWADVHKLESFGITVNPAFISALKKRSGQNDQNK